MAMGINTNVASLNAQGNLNKSQSALQTSLQRLSSGMRINSSKDDAAGLAISNRMTSQINGLNQAARNANDGVSLSQTAEGALQNTGDTLQRLRTLAVQASNATNTASDREALQKESNDLVAELDRMAVTTQFNGQNILDGTMGTATFQVGANANQTIQMAGVNFRTTNYGNNSAGVNQAAVGAATKVVGGDITIAGYSGSSKYTAAATDTAKTIAAGVNAMSDKTGVTATAKTTANLGLGDESYSIDIKSDNATAVTVAFTIADSTTADGMSRAVDAINAHTSKTGVIAEYDKTNGGIKLTNATGNDITIKNSAAAPNTKLNVDSYKTNGTLVGPAYDAKDAGAIGVVNGTVSFDSKQSFSVTDAGSGLALTKTSTLDSVSGIDLTSFDSAQKALKTIDAAIGTVDGQRATYGALQSRFLTTISNLNTSSENLSSARSRIQDTDFAAETANMTRNQILQQAGTAMLAQANQLPQSVLSLLK